MSAQNGESELLDLAGLKPGQKLAGTITRLELFGAFADVGAEAEGLIHISKLSKKRITRVQDAVKVGDAVDVWIEKVDPAAKRLELTLIQPVALPWKDIKPGLTRKGRITRLERYGAFVDIGAERSGLIHVSEMGVGYLSDPSEILAVGDEVRVTVLEADRKKKQIRLSMDSPVEDMEAEEKELPTAMELALREAMGESEESRASSTSAKAASEDRKRKEQDDLLARTLSQRMQTSTSTEE